MEPITWNDFTDKVAEYRHSQELFCGKLTNAENSDRDVLIFGEEKAYLELKDATQINIQVIRNVETKFSSYICVVYKIEEIKVSIAM